MTTFYGGTSNKLCNEKNLITQHRNLLILIGGKFEGGWENEDWWKKNREKEKTATVNTNDQRCTIENEFKTLKLEGGKKKQGSEREAPWNG